MSKRPGSESEALIKRTKLDAEDPALQQLVVASDGNASRKGALIQTVRRTSGLQAPIMCLQVSSTILHQLDYSSPSSLPGPPRRNPRRQVLARRRVDCFGWSGQDDPAVEGLRQLHQVSLDRAKEYGAARAGGSSWALGWLARVLLWLVELVQG